MSVRKILFLAVVCLGLIACMYLTMQVVWPPLATFRGHRSRVVAVATSSDGKTLATMSEDKTIKLWDMATCKQRATLRGGEAAFRCDGNTLACTDGKTIKLWDVRTGMERGTLLGHRNSVHAVVFSPDGTTLASASSDKTVKLWDLATGKERFTLHRNRYWVSCVAFSPDGKTLASASYDTITLWDVETGKERASLQGHRYPVGCLAFSPDGKSLASGDWGFVKLWDVASGKTAVTLDGHDETVEAVVFSPDGTTLASLGIDDKLNLWDVASGEKRATFTFGGTSPPRPRLFRLLRAVLDHYPSIPEPLPGSFATHAKHVLSVFFTPDGKVVALGMDTRDDRTVKMWVVTSLENGRQ